MAHDTMVDASDERGRTTELDALVIGAGFAGLYQLLCLRDRLGLSVRALEAGGGVGGTWYWNRYPGARCDSESHVYWYTFSAELMREWEWSERYPGQAEILRYLDFVADKFDLKRDIQFNSRVTSAHYDEAANRWRVCTEQGEVFVATFLVTAVGCLSTANVPKIPGLEDFGGDWYHTGQWPRRCRFYRQTRWHDWDRLDRNPGRTGDCRARQAFDGVSTHRELFGSRPERATNARIQTIRKAERGRDQGDHAPDVQWNGFQGRGAKSGRNLTRGARENLRSGVGTRRLAVPCDVPGHADQQGGERHGRGFHQTQNPLDREGPQDRGDPVEHRPSLRCQASADRYRLFRDLQPPQRIAG